MIFSNIQTESMNDGSVKVMAHFCSKVFCVHKLLDSWVKGSTTDVCPQEGCVLPMKLSAFGIARFKGRAELKFRPGRLDWKMMCAW